MATSKRPSKRALAYHEAGHAVACLVLGIPVLRVTIRESKRRWGLTTHVDTVREAERKLRRGAGCVATVRAQADRMAMVALAGSLAEWKARIRGGPTRCGSSDWIFAEKLLARLWTRPGGDHRFVVAYRRTNELLRHSRVWTAVKDTAGALLDNETLSGCEAAKIVSAAGFFCSKHSQISAYYVQARYSRPVLDHISASEYVRNSCPALGLTASRHISRRDRRGD